MQKVSRHSLFPYRPCYWHVCDCHHAIHWCCTSTVAGHKTFDAVGAKTKQLCAFSLLRSPSLVASNHNFQERNRYIHSFVLFCNDAALGPYPGILSTWGMCSYWQELGNALSNLEVCWLMGLMGWRGFFGFSRQYLNRVSWFCAKGIFKPAKLQFLRTIQTQKLVDSAVRCFRTGWLPHV